MKTPWIGIDVGGANLKAANARGWTAVMPFALWKNPDRLSDAVGSILATAPAVDDVALTMTGELADCYEDRSVGVCHIIDAVSEAMSRRWASDSGGVCDRLAPCGKPRGGRLKVYSVGGGLLEATQAKEQPDRVAAANWHVLANYARRWVQADQNALLIDVGSTTTDIIPVERQGILTDSQTDTDRLSKGELLYFGSQRTPLCAVTRGLDFRGTTIPLMAELFATTDDCGIVLGAIAEDSGDYNSADGKPRDVPHSVNRLARVIGLDRRNFTLADARSFADQIRQSLQQRIAEAATNIAPNANVWIVSGHGAWLIPEPSIPVLEIERQWNNELSRVAPAFALACLAEEAASAKESP